MPVNTQISLLLEWSKSSLTSVVASNTRGQSCQWTLLVPMFFPWLVHHRAHSPAFPQLWCLLWCMLDPNPSMDVGRGWSNGQMLEKKLAFHTTPGVIENPSLCLGEMNTQPDVASWHLSVEPRLMVITSHPPGQLKGKLALVEGYI